jgi:imidazolonepropionase-like amidohydrolase
MENVLFTNAKVFDGVENALKDLDVMVADGKIAEVSEKRLKPGKARTIDLKGKTLMPGLIDAHVHCYFPDVDPLKGDRMPMTLVAHWARKFLEGALHRGFTSVRDTGGADYGLFLAVERGWVNGPRLFYCGKALSPTGGHADMRRPHEEELCTCGHAAHSHVGQVVDGVDSVRTAIRQEVRRGASFIKIMGSGGVASTGDKLDAEQYSRDEIRAMVEEVEMHRIYLTAHIHPDGALRRAIELGLHCIEHGTLVTPPTAKLAAEKGTSIVPTMAVIKALAKHGASLGFPKESLAKLAAIEPTAVGGLEIMKKAGVRMGFGTDLIGELDRHQCTEFTIRREALDAIDILRSATSVNAEIIGAADSIGRVAPGLVADLIVVDGDPLRDVSVFQEDGRNVPLVMKGGRIVKG